MKAWQIEADLGLLELSRHRPRSALPHLARALRDCPERRGAELARILFYLGMTMRKLGFANPALRSWLVSQRLSKRGLGSRMLARYANEYGMERQGSTAEDDWQAFYSVQARRYLQTRAGNAFQSVSEERLVAELIRSHWEALCGRFNLAGLAPSEKCSLFRGVRIELPAFVAADGDLPIVVDFAHGRRVGLEDRCICGSGLVFRACCGRIEGVDELIHGT
jgi:hypothetical protein